MSERTTMPQFPFARLAAACALCLFFLAWATVAFAAEKPPSAARSAGQRIYGSPQAAVDDLVAAVRADDLTRIEAILGTGSRNLVRSGDAVADRQERGRFVASYEQHATIDMQDDDRATLLIGEHDWPFPVPVVKSDRGWRFDTATGATEALVRRIGRNELSAIQVCLAYVDAQRDYAASAGNDDGIHQYARKFGSSPGRKDGLYWPTREGEKLSPLGVLVARSHAEGYHRQPYHGYYYRILTAQGGGAAGGAYDYIVKGRMIGGFALVAYPARWGASGVMTLIVNHDGVVYEKNLGRETAAIASKMARFDPDSSWSKVER